MRQTVIDVLEELEATSGRNDKEAILKRHRDNELLKQVFVAAQDPYTVYYVNKFKAPKPRIDALSGDDDIIYSFLVDLLPQLSARELTGNAAKDAVTEHFKDMIECQQKWCSRILLKNLRVGVQESTVNKVWPGTIKSFAVSLAETLKSEFIKGEGIKILGRVQYPVRVEPKLDGLRCIAVKNKGVVTFYTRNGTVLETLPTIKAVLEAATYDDFVLDGEAMGSDWNESASVLMSRKDKKDDSNIVYNVFDGMHLNEWIDQSCPRHYAERLEDVRSITIPLEGSNAPVRAVPYLTATNEAVLRQYFQECMDKGYEGVMLKDVSAPYKFKRSDNILKLKPVTTYEGVVVGHYEGRRGTKREGQFGGFEVVLPNGVVTRVGGGFNDAMRAEVQLRGPDHYLGTIVEIEAQPDPTTKDGLTADGRARFPVFTRFRDAADVDPAVIAAGDAHVKGNIETQ